MKLRLASTKENVDSMAASYKRKAPTRLREDNGANFKVKIRKKE